MQSPIENKLNTTFVPVSDLGASVKWYCDLIGHPFDSEKISPPVYNLPIAEHTGVVLDAGLGNVEPSPHPLFNFHTEDIDHAYHYVKELGYTINDNMERFDDISYFTIKDPDGNIVMICNA